MSDTQKNTSVQTREAEAPSLLDQILDGMDRRVTATLQRVQPIEINNFDDLWRWAQMAAKSRMVPKDYIGNPEAIMVAVDMGAELGLRRMQALQGIAVINGRPAIWGDALWSLVICQPTLENVQEFYEGEGDNYKAVCIIKRRGRAAVRKEFSVADAKVAKLWNKRGSSGQDTPWITYPDRMLQMRARGFAARDAYADALKGVITAEEARDIPEDLDGPVITPFKQAAPTAVEGEDAVASESASDLTARFDRAISAIQDADVTEAAYGKIERKVTPLLADLEAAGHESNRRLLAETLAEYREAVFPTDGQEDAA